MILHVSGCDATGKSTLCEHLCEITNGKYTHFDKPKDLEDGKMEYFSFLNTVDYRNTYICDRFHDGEWVYAPLYRGYMGDYLGEFENAIRDTDDYLFVYVTAELETILERARSRGEDFVKEDDFSKVLDNFKNNYLMNQKMPFIIIDTTNVPKEESIKKILKSMTDIQVINNCILCKEYFNFNLEQPAAPRGNIDAKYMIVDDNILNDDSMVEKLKNTGKYLDCWLTDVLDSELISLQYKLINPQFVISLNEETTKKIKSKLFDANVIEIKSIEDICNL